MNLVSFVCWSINDPVIVSSTGLGNCGGRNDRNQKVIAISKEFYDRNKGNNCGQVCFSSTGL